MSDESTNEKTDRKSPSMSAEVPASPGIVSISKLADHLGETVKLRGWLYNKRSSGELHFLEVRDGTGIVQAVVFKGNVSPELFASADHIQQVLIKRRDKIAVAWLNATNPLVNFTLANDGTLTFENAAVNAKASTPGSGYAVSWSRFDNATDTHQAVGPEATFPSPTARAPQGFETSQYIAVTVKSMHPDHPAWAQPIRAYFRREGAGWKTVGLERQP